mgnify:CR=1 FL=1
MSFLEFSADKVCLFQYTYVICIQLEEMEKVGEETLVLAVHRPTRKLRMFGTNRGLAYGNSHIEDVGNGFLFSVTGVLTCLHDLLFMNIMAIAD